MSYHDLVFEWKGETLTVPSNRVFKLGARAECVLPGLKLVSYLHDLNTANLHTLASVYAEVLRFAGFSVTDAEALDVIWDKNGALVYEKLHEVTKAILPPQKYSELFLSSEPEGDEGEESPVKKPSKAVKKALSKTTSKQR